MDSWQLVGLRKVSAQMRLLAQLQWRERALARIHSAPRLRITFPQGPTSRPRITSPQLGRPASAARSRLARSAGDKRAQPR